MELEHLDRLARLYGVLTTYVDAHRRVHRVSVDGILPVLQALGAPIQKAQDAAEAIRWRRQELLRSPLQPVYVAWEGLSNAIDLRVQAQRDQDQYAVAVHTEDGRQWNSHGVLRDIPTIRQKTVEGVSYTLKRLALPEWLKSGYHRMHMDSGGKTWESLIIAAPVKAFAQPAGSQPGWGVFMPLHALHSHRSWGGGDLGDLESAVDWVADQGGSAMQILPILAELREPGTPPAPYSPDTRLFWDECYLDVTGIPHLSQCQAARDMLSDGRLQEELKALRAAPMVDYVKQAALKRRVVEALAKWYFSGADHSGLDSYRKREPLAESFAVFRAISERLKVHWERWPARLRRGEIHPSDYEADKFQYHLYSQWQLDEQLGHVAGNAAARRVRLCLDLPLGVKQSGFDPWNESELFVPGMAMGAPPDPFFLGGQNWSLPPIHPQRLREQGYRYFMACLRRHLRHAKILRLDHVMGLYRLFWVPEGMPADQGVYVRYPSSELLAILALESQRHQAVIVGENLGTVPEYVNRSMRRHRILSTYVVPFNIAPEESPPVTPPVEDCVASLNTHDLPTFASFWRGVDIRRGLKMGLHDRQGAKRQCVQRRLTRRALLAWLRGKGMLSPQDDDPHSVLKACLAMLGASAANLVMVNMEDTWGETRPQNMPGVGPDLHANWQGKARYSLEEFSRMPEVLCLFAMLDRWRKGVHRG